MADKARQGSTLLKASSHSSNSERELQDMSIEKVLDSTLQDDKSIQDKKSQIKANQVSYLSQSSKH